MRILNLTTNIHLPLLWIYSYSSIGSIEREWRATYNIITRMLLLLPDIYHIQELYIITYLFIFRSLVVADNIICKCTVHNIYKLYINVNVLCSY